MMGPDSSPASHLDDESLSAVLDGEAIAAEDEHAGSCGRCSARLTELRAAASVVASFPPSPSPERREAAVAAALALQPAPSSSPDSPSLAKEAAATGDRLGGRRRRSVPGWVPLAALAAAVALFVPVVGLLVDGGDDSQQTAMSELEDDDRAGDPAAGTDDSVMAAAPLEWGNLGDVDGGDLAELAARIGAGAAAPASDGQATSDEADAQATEAAPPSDAARGAPSSPASELPAACEAEARSRDPGLGQLLAVGRGTVDGNPAEILAFESMPTGSNRSGATRVVATASEGCAELASGAG